ncbi:retinol dehydrogenase 14 [Leptodontidium sp. MPI-SDFR-AT-0119]|nr:retinol dehydrogenase 14 [Leptodontidium sp. MPI-SDFR-AT-0119]
MAKSSFNPINDIPELGGKVFLITGGTAGLGAGCITALAAHKPAHIYFTGRNASKGIEIVTKVQEKHRDVSLTFIECDMASLESVQAAARRFHTISDRLDVFVCNACIMAVDADTSKDGYEIQFQVNHLAHALLIRLLLPTMLRTASQVGADVRIVSLSSSAYKQAPKTGIDFATLNTPQATLGNAINPGHKWSRYGQSKLSNLLYVHELAKRYPEILSVAVHPGAVMTNLWGSLPLATRLPALLITMGDRVSVEQGPYTQLWAATSERSGIRKGEYYEPIGIIGKKTTIPSRDPSLAAKLWDWTEKAIATYD